MLQNLSMERSSAADAGIPIDRDRLVARYRKNRERSRFLFELLTDDEAHYSQPIPLRHPFVFYEGHVPAFSFNTLVKNALGGKSLDPDLEGLFARGIDPPTDPPLAAQTDAARNRALWPDRLVVRQFAEAADERVIDALLHGDIDRPGHPLLDQAEAVFVILEHEAMHQETLLYMLHRVPYALKRPPEGYRPRVGAAVPPGSWITIPPGRATLGRDRSAEYAWDNESPRHTERVGTFAIESCNVTNAAFMEFVEAGGYRDDRFWRPAERDAMRRATLIGPPFWEQRDGGWFWRGLFEAIPLPPSWPVYVSHAEAEAYARFRGARLATEAEFQRAAYGTPDGEERRFPWGADPPQPLVHGVFDFASWDPWPVGSQPGGRSAWGLDDLVGNGWEWTGTAFAPFPGFRPQATYPAYSADFFDGEHFVLKGASPVTARELLRPTFRNWFRGRYPYMYATFRCTKGLA
jgi:ergothioneine biosynthesis protein EgtB